ncbi:MAG TPA: pirin family protein [Steroidobacteraceae bacterium]|nr:pirin family protein [Steroidobacteraceae bacterium]
MTVAHILKPRWHDLGGGMMVRRLLPAAAPQGVGPFVFFDHFGPIDIRPGSSIDVRPHPHIGLATVTYLFEGAMVHRDSLGMSQRIEPGAINWMTAGRGIVHSERQPNDLRGQDYRLHGVQLWAALPVEREEADPAFIHTPATQLPTLESGGARVRVLIGESYGLSSPVATLVETLYLDVNAPPQGRLELEPTEMERAVYSVSQRLVIDGLAVEGGNLALLKPGVHTSVTAPEGARFIVIGGAPLDGHRHIWWNFVSSRRERLLQAKEDWAAQRMGTIPGEQEWMPLPQ